MAQGGVADTYGRVLELLERLGNLVREDTRKAEPPGLAPVHRQILTYLARCNRFSNHPLAVAQYLGLTKGTVSVSLSVLEHKGLVRREDDPRDRRQVRLFLTEEGERIVAAGASLQGALEAWARLGPRGRMLEELLEEFLRELLRARKGRPFGPCRLCRYLDRSPEGLRCSLLDEPLSETDVEKICREQEPSEVSS